MRTRPLNRSAACGRSYCASCHSNHRFIRCLPYSFASAIRRLSSHYASQTCSRSSQSGSLGASRLYHRRSSRSRSSSSRYRPISTYSRRAALSRRQSCRWTYRRASSNCSGFPALRVRSRSPVQSNNLSPASRLCLRSALRGNSTTSECENGCRAL